MVRWGRERARTMSEVSANCDWRSKVIGQIWGERNGQTLNGRIGEAKAEGKRGVDLVK